MTRFTRCKLASRAVLLSGALLAASAASAFPINANFTANDRSFGLGFTSRVNGGGCASADETRGSTYSNQGWVVTLAVTEDDCGDDELKVVGTAQHLSTVAGDPNGPVFSFAFDLMGSRDASHFNGGNHALAQQAATLAHLFPHNFTFQYDIFQADLSFHVDEGFLNNDIDSYTFSLSGRAVSEPGALALSLLGLAGALWPRLRRSQRPSALKPS